MKLLPVPVQFNYRGATDKLFQHLGFPFHVLFKYLRKLLCWRWVWAAILVGCWTEAVLPHCSSSSLLFFLPGDLWSFTPSHLNRVMMKNYWYHLKLQNCSWHLSERFLYFMELSGCLLCMSVWIFLELSAAWQPTEHHCHTQRDLVVSPSFSWKGCRGLLQPLFTSKIIFNGDYQVVVCHHSCLPGGARKHSFPGPVRQFQQPQTKTLLKWLYCVIVMYHQLKGRSENSF